MRSKDLLNTLRHAATAHGWEFRERPGRGSHVVVTVNGRSSSIPMHRGDMPEGTYRGILRALGLKPEDLKR